LDTVSTAYAAVATNSTTSSTIITFHLCFKGIFHTHSHYKLLAQ